MKSPRTDERSSTGAMSYTSDVEAVLGRIRRERFPIFNLYHFYFFSKRTLRQLFTNNGFEVLRVVSTSNSYSLRFLVQKIPMAPARTVRRALDTVGIGRWRVTAPLGCIAIVARRPDDDR